MHHRMHHHLPDAVPSGSRRRREFGPNFFGPPFGRFGPGPARGRGRGGPPWRTPRGNIRVAILLLLHERPMHGYELITELEERSAGLWRPSAGSIYPTLSLLEDEGLITSTEEEGKRRFSLTDAGVSQVNERGEGPTPWDEVAQGVNPDHTKLRQSGGALFAALGQVAHAGSPEQVSAATAIVDECRRRIYGLLADAPPAS